MKKPLIFGISVISIIILFFIFSKGEMMVLIKNECEKEIPEIKVEYTGGSFEVSSLAPKKTKARLINPKGESTLILKFKDPFTNQTKSQNLDLYFEANYRGKIEINFDANGKVNRRIDHYWP